MRSVRSILFGLLIVLAAAVLVWWNEGRTLGEARALAEGERIVTSIDSAVIDAKNEGKLVHLSGPTTSPEAVRDDDLGVEARGLQLSRKVEMLQWKETRSSRGDSEANLTYSRVWSAEPIDWTKFRVPQDHRNPPFPDVAPREFIGKDIRIGAFRISDEIIAMLGSGSPFNPPPSIIPELQHKLGRPVQAIQGGIFAGADPAAASVGDVRILYSLLPHQTVSVIGRQSGNGIAAFKASNDDRILLASTGQHAAADMFDFAQDANTMTAWSVRLFGVLIIYVGCRVILHPLRMVASYAPLVDSLAGFSAAIAALVLTLIIAPVVIALAWLAYRPLTAVLVAAVGIAVAGGVLNWHRRRQSPPTATA